jgi:hypothetical protein
VVHFKEIEDNVSDHENDEDKAGDAQPKVLKVIIVTSPDQVLEPFAPTAQGAQGWLVDGTTDGLVIVSEVKSGIDKVTGA